MPFVFGALFWGAFILAGAKVAKVENVRFLDCFFAALFSALVRILAGAPLIALLGWEMGLNADLVGWAVAAGVNMFFIMAILKVNFRKTMIIWIVSQVLMWSTLLLIWLFFRAIV